MLEFKYYTYVSNCKASEKLAANGLGISAEAEFSVPSA